MRKVILTVCILIASFASLTADAVWTVQSGVNLIPGLVYNRTWDPGYQGSAISVMPLRRTGDLVLGAGAELGYSYTGFHALIPFRAGLIVAERGSISFSGNIEVMPGVILGRPAPWFLFAAEVSAEAVWRVSPRFALGVSVGPRYTVSPGYSRAISPLETVDLTIGVFAIGG